MARPKGSKSKDVDMKAETEERGVLEVETGSPSDAGEKIAPLEEIATQDTWRYHATQEPRIFRKGETIPAGWEKAGTPTQKQWACDAAGKFSKVGGAA